MEDPRPSPEEAAKTFKDHVSDYRVLTSSAPLLSGIKIEFLHWHKPGTGIYSIRYYCHWGALMATGDCGDAVWQFNRDADLKWIANCDVGYYAMSKLVASPHGRYGKTWNENQARKRIQEYMKQREEEEEGWKWKGPDPLESAGCEFEWTSFLQDYGGELFGDPCEYGDIGMVTDYCLLLQLMGLQIAMQRSPFR